MREKKPKNEARKTKSQIFGSAEEGGPGEGRPRDGGSARVQSNVDETDFV